MERMSRQSAFEHFLDGGIADWWGRLDPELGARRLRQDVLLVSSPDVRKNRRQTALVHASIANQGFSVDCIGIATICGFVTRERAFLQPHACLSVGTQT